MRPRLVEKVVLLPLAAVVSLSVAGCATHREMVAADRDGQRLRLQLAQAYVKKGAIQAAIPFARRAVDEAPDDVEARTLYATVLREQRLYKQAEEQFRAAIALDGKHAPAFAGLALLYDLTRRPEDARRVHEKALGLSPKSADYWNNHGFSRFVAGRVDESIAAFEKALALNPSLTVAYNNLGFALARRREYARAFQSFQTAGGDGAARANLALAYRWNGDAVPDELRAALEAELEKSKTTQQAMKEPR